MLIQKYRRYLTITALVSVAITLLIAQTNVKSASYTENTCPIIPPVPSITLPPIPTNIPRPSLTPKPKGTTIGDTIWLDSNTNGIQDNNESGISGVIVQLLDKDKHIIRAIKTTRGGHYLFGRLHAGEYYVQVFLPKSNRYNYQFTAPNQGSNDCKDSDIHPIIVGADFNVSTTAGITNKITLQANQIDLCWDGGIIATPKPTNTPAPTATPQPTVTSTPTNTPTPTTTPEPTSTPTSKPTVTPTIIPTVTPTPTQDIGGSRISFELSKLVRKSDKDKWSEKVKGVKSNGLVEFKITVKNTGNTTVDELKLHDILPENLVLTSEYKDWTITNLAPNEEISVTLEAKANTTGIETGQTKCVKNTVELSYEDKIRNSDDAEVCIDAGSVLGEIDELPDTAGASIFNNKVFGSFVILLLLGLILANSTNVLERLYKK